MGVASTLTNVLHSDIGRPIHHISVNNLYKDFLDDINQVMENLEPIEKEVRDNTNQWFLMRIIPYRTAENAVEGIIITFVNITSLKDSQSDYNVLENRLETAMKMAKLTWWQWNVKTNTVISGDSKYTMLGYTKKEIDDGYEG